MFEHILDCPRCGHRFHYEHEGGDFPEFIHCPGCGMDSGKNDYEVLIFCQECHVKVKLPLSMLNDENNCCPRCGAVIPVERLPMTQEVLLQPGVPPQNEKKRMLEDGSYFDKFRIIRLLGRGGMAEVYLAEHMLLKQQCALKLMQRSLDQDDNPVFIKRFLREAKLTHRLTHPNIVKVFDAGSDFKTGYLFLAMEYIEGKTLHNTVRERQLSEEEMLEILMVISDALRDLEKNKVVHRDIKPSNIMRHRDGSYKLMDLGIAKMESSQQTGEMTLTMEKSTIGTPGYASPEQCSSAHHVDNRSDIFSLGATIYHAASGVIPFEGDTPVAAILKTMQKDPESLRKYRSDLSDGFIALVEKMMKKNPEDRFQNVDELQEAIEKVKNGSSFTDSVGKVKDSIVLFGSGCRKVWQVTAAFCASLSKLKPLFTALKNGFTTLYRTLSSWAQRAFAGNLPNGEENGFVRKLVKLFLLLCVAAVAALHLYYGVNCLQGKTGKIGYVGFMKKFAVNLLTRDDLPLLERVATAAIFSGEETPKEEVIDRAALIRQRIEDAHPLVLDPDTTLLPVSKGGIPQYLAVGLAKPLKKKNLVKFDFKKADDPIKYTVPAVFHDGLLDLQKQTQAVPFLPEKSKNGECWSVFLNFQLTESAAAGIISVNKLELFVLNGTIRLLYAGYYTDTNIKVKPGNWMNLAVSMNHREGRIDLLSNDLLLGSYLFPRSVQKQFSALRFHSPLLEKKMTGRIDFLALCNQALSIVPRTPLQRKPFTCSSQRLPDGIPLRVNTPVKVEPVKPSAQVQILQPAVAEPPKPVKPAEVKRTHTQFSHPAFIRSWEHKDMATIRKALSSGGVSADLKLRDGRTLLSSACAAEDLELVKLLLACGADPNFRDGKKELPLGAGRDIFSLPENLETFTKIILLMLENGAKLSEPLLERKPQYGLLAVIISKYPNKNELLPMIARYIKDIPPVQWEEIFYTYNMTRSERQGGLSEANKRLLLEHCPVSVLKQHFSYIILRVRLTPQTLQKMFANGLKPNDLMPHNAYINGRRKQVNRPLLYLLVIDRQPVEVVETALKAGAYDNLRTWKDENGKTLSDLARDPSVRRLLEQYKAL